RAYQAGGAYNCDLHFLKIWIKFYVRKYDECLSILVLCLQKTAFSQLSDDQPRIFGSGHDRQVL
ncbi:MAG TPA: hypothetical protein VGE15_11645, partial [Sphingobacteriaceae bacterium]